MNTPAPKPDAFDKLLDTYVEELKEMSEAQALDGADPATVEKQGAALLQQSREAAGRRRLAAARAKLARETASPNPVGAEPAVSAQEARSYLARASNDHRYTMAARELKDMSDEEALRLYTQMKKLEREQLPPDQDA